MSTYPDAIDFAADRERTLNSIAEPARRAKGAGHLRPDLVLDDLILILMANSGIRATPPAARLAASRRFAALAIQALQASPAASPLPPAARLARGIDTPTRLQRANRMNDRRSHRLARR
ncbi:hypothetical protein FB471_5595 [Amycolatopsis cihanbeyliensis]|uniref:TetR family transcriptional regulator n=2 Tax=Amycolatopsis cihanbeyliensis TaxID=1128664 RepID=A0A542DRP6_AMYCI|nr:hypothetical protein FB471_5595 [Amycolatopsis cihanbeyliensis]